MTPRTPGFHGISEFLGGTGRTLLWIAWAVGGYAVALVVSKAIGLLVVSFSYIAAAAVLCGGMYALGALALQGADRAAGLRRAPAQGLAQPALAVTAGVAAVIVSIVTAR